MNRKTIASTIAALAAASALTACQKAPDAAESAASSLRTEKTECIKRIVTDQYAGFAIAPQNTMVMITSNGSFKTLYDFSKMSVLEKNDDTLRETGYASLSPADRAAFDYIKACASIAPKAVAPVAPAKPAVQQPVAPQAKAG